MSPLRALAAGLLLAASAFAASDLAVGPGVRVVMDAHNCYPYDGRWADRIDRALSAGTPLAIEQDLFWYTDKATGKSRSLVTHGKPVNGSEPGMREYFFERIRPVMEKALSRRQSRQLAADYAESRFQNGRSEASRGGVEIIGRIRRLALHRRARGGSKRGDADSRGAAAGIVRRTGIPGA